jgi:hypothetical protein
MRPPSSKLRFQPRDLFVAWLAATVFSGLPSTLYALVSGADPLEATRAAGAMLLPAAIVHPLGSLFWVAVFGCLLPRRRVALWRNAAASAPECD